MSDGKIFYTIKDSGLADIVFRGEKNIEKVENLPNSSVAIGHNRYSTSGSLSEMQPFVDDGIAHDAVMTDVKNDLRSEGEKK